MSDILVLTGDRNRDLLEEWLTTSLDHSVTNGPAQIGPDLDSDLCIVDSRHLRAHGDALRSIKVAEHPVFYPVVLVTADGQGDRDSLVGLSLGEYEYIVDEILQVPVSQRVLERRLESLLRIRHQSNELRESETRFKALLDQNLSGVFLASTNRFEYVNERLADMFGFPRSELLGREIDSLVVDLEQERLVEDLGEYQSGLTDSITGTYEGQRADGEPLHFMLEAHRIDLSEGSVTIGTVVDITEQVLASRETERRAEELALLNQIIRHDVRNDLNVLLGWGETLYDHIDEDGRPVLDRILNTAYHIFDLTVAIRDLTDMLDDTQEATLEPVDLVEILEIEVDTVMARYEGTHEVSIDLRTPDGSVEVMASGMLASVFDNLLTNAIRHNNKPKAEIEVDVAVEAKSVAVSVADNGPGVQTDQMDTIFGRGEKGLKSSGSGLGLYLVDQVVGAFDGTVTVENNEPNGAVFRVTLPVA